MGPVARFRTIRVTEAVLRCFSFHLSADPVDICAVGGREPLTAIVEGAHGDDITAGG
ncbi:Uncharacterised protein [Mycobacteroides abscessus subsp. abscessus]|nr:Uncharacterised protein [Mycobacteroides abscessus subsp. abscessus]SIN20345.1 Uncharacterised protein [Mycobacteroides abscessus subsp. abscessus]SKQ67105.1 Uncharacterised protein [Mycobacteroides abscessus subsp. abscessus]SKX40622.1 Uncharacterised protein [Mycobacteroides abscessus subsp. abscessus]